MTRNSVVAVYSVLVLTILIASGCATNFDKSSKTFNALGYEYHKEGQYDKAIVEYNRALELNPQNFEAYVNRGNSYATKGQYNLAIADYNKAIEINPKYSMAYQARQYVSVPLNMENYAIFLKEMGRNKEATEMEEQTDIFLKSLQSKESNSYLGFIPSEVLREYAILLHQEGEANKAVEMNSLADWWDQANINAAEQLYEKTTDKKIKEPTELMPGKKYIKIYVPESVYEGGKVKFNVIPGDTLEIIRIKRCLDGKKECWVVRNVKTGETGVVGANRMKYRQHVYTEE